MTATADRPDAMGPRWPDLFLAGAAHAGTSLLRGHLRRHPAILMSEPEEPHFFSAIRPARRFESLIPVVRDEAAYRALFAAARPGQVTGEASTSYLWSAEAPDRMAAAVPDARVVLVLRDPIARAWAHHRHDQAQGVERRGFLRAIRDELQRPARWGHEPVYLGAGLYADGLERFRAAFGSDRVQVRFFESLEVDPRAAACDLLAWLGLDPACAEAPAAMPPGAPARRSGGLLGALHRGRPATAPAPVGTPAMDDTIRRLLAEVFAADVARVSDLLGVIATLEHHAVCLTRPDDPVRRGPKATPTCWDGRGIGRRAIRGMPSRRNPDRAQARGPWDRSRALRPPTPIAPGQYRWRDLPTVRSCCR